MILSSRTRGRRGMGLWHVVVQNRLASGGALAFGVLALLALLGPELVTGYAPSGISSGPAMSAPSAAHWFGTDELGRDVMSRTIAGLRVSLTVGITATLLGMIIGVVVGGIAGFMGGFLDAALMRMTEVFMIIPGFFLALLMVSLFGPSLLNISVAIAVLAWPITARIVRSEFLTLRNRQFCDAARVAGASWATLAFREILPNAFGAIIVTQTLQLAQSMIIEAGLSYLGLGDPAHVSLGLILQQTQGIMREAWWAAVFPGLFIAMAALSANLMGDALNDALNPRSRVRR